MEWIFDLHTHWILWRAILIVWIVLSIMTSLYREAAWLPWLIILIIAGLFIESCFWIGYLIGIIF